MLKNPDHVTVVVTDLAASRAFFEVLGFEVSSATVVSGDVFETYMDVPDIEADHVTMVLVGCEPRFEVQLLHYRRPEVSSDPKVRDLARPGFNHLCFAVDDMDEVSERLRAAGVAFRNDVMAFHDRKLVFVEGPEGITIELAEWSVG
ncbi:MAG: VOC family protein [Pseudomonadota bacterium]